MTPQSLKEAFQRGENITEILRRNSGLAQNTEKIIETAYALQPARAWSIMATAVTLSDPPKSLGMKVTAHEVFPHTSNPLNPTALTVIEKAPSAAPAIPRFACPRWKTLLEDRGDSFYSPESLCALSEDQWNPLSPTRGCRHRQRLRCLFVVKKPNNPAPARPFARGC